MNNGILKDIINGVKNLPKIFKTGKYEKGIKACKEELSKVKELNEDLIRNRHILSVKRTSIEDAISFNRKLIKEAEKGLEEAEQGKTKLDPIHKDLYENNLKDLPKQIESQKAKLNEIKNDLGNKIKEIEEKIKTWKKNGGKEAEENLLKYKKDLKDAEDAKLALLTLTGILGVILGIVTFIKRVIGIGNKKNSYQKSFSDFDLCLNPTRIFFK